MSVDGPYRTTSDEKAQIIHETYPMSWGGLREVEDDVVAIVRSAARNWQLGGGGIREGETSAVT